MSRSRGYTHGPHIFKRGAYWYSRVPGLDPAEQSLRTKDKAEAERAHAARVAALHGGAGEAPRGEVPPSAPTLDDLAGRYLTAEHDHTPRTAKSMRLRVLAFVRWCARQTPVVEAPADLTHDVVEQWIRDRRATVTRRQSSLTQTTIARDFKAVRRWLAWCTERRHIDKPVEAFAERRAPREPRRVSAGEIPSPREIGGVARELRRRKQPGAALALVVLLATGLRRSELRDLTAEAVTDREIKAPPGKGHKERLLPVSPEVAKAAREFIALRDTPQGRGRHAHDIGAGLDDHWTGRVLAPACEAAKVPRFGAHDVRRTFATECVRAGVDVLTVQRWMGHTSVNTTQRYLGHYRDDAPVEVPTPRALSIATKGRKR